VTRFGLYPHVNKLEEYDESGDNPTEILANLVHGRDVSRGYDGPLSTRQTTLELGGMMSHLSESRGNRLLSRRSSNDLDNFGVEQRHLAEGGVERELLVVRGD